MGYPDPSEVLVGVVFGASDELTGTYTPPNPAEVIDGVTFGAELAEVGTCVLPAVGKVRNDTSYGNAGEFTGTFAPPAAEEVLLDVGYGEDGTELTGNVRLPAQTAVVAGTENFGPSDTLEPLYAPVAVGDVRKDISYGPPGGELLGTLELPLEETVIAPTTYGEDAVEFTGTYTAIGPEHVRVGQSYGVLATAGQLDGALALPEVETVQAGVQYGTDGTELTGTLPSTEVAGPTLASAVDLGMRVPGSVVFIPWHTFAAAGGGVTAGSFSLSNVRIYKNGSTVERASSAGWTLIDTDGKDIDGRIGLHGLYIDLANNAVADFYSAGASYLVALCDLIVDGKTASFFAAQFQIGYPTARLNTTIATLASQTSFTLTDGPAEANALRGMEFLFHDKASGVQVASAVCSAYAVTTKTVTLAAAPTFTIEAGDNVSVMGRAPLQPSTPGLTALLTAGGHIGIDWGNVTGQSTGVSLIGTTVANVTTTATASNLTNPAQVVAASVRNAIGMSAANLDTQLTAIANDAAAILTRIPAALFSGITSLANWLRAGLRKGNIDATTTDEINATTGSGTGTYDATTDANEALADSADYVAEILFTRDVANAVDEYTVSWFRNGAPILSGITSPTIKVSKRSDGTDLVALDDLVAIGSTGAYKHDETTALQTEGEAVLVTVAATIDGSARTFRRLLGRDSQEE